MARQETLNEFLQRHERTGKPVKIPESYQKELTLAERDKLNREYIKHLEAKQAYLMKRMRNR